jgi:probable HAF family extracellular repeat protein
VNGMLALGIGTSFSANAQTYSFVDLGTLDGSISSGKGINTSGQVVGVAYTAGDSAAHATLWNGSTRTDLTPGKLGYSSVANDINGAGQVVGEMVVQLGGNSGNWGWRATVWSGGVSTVLGALPGTTHNDAQAINSFGQIAGRSIIDPYSGHYHATVWNGTTPTDLGIDSGAYGINDVGQVVGSRSLTGNFGGIGTYATIWNGVTGTSLAALVGTTRSEARDINDAGKVVGWSLINENSYHATVWNGSVAIDFGTGNSIEAINNLDQMVGTSNGRVTVWNGTAASDLNSFLDASTISQGWVIVSATDISDEGWIVGNASNSITGQTHAYMLSVTTPVAAPVPEPETYAMMLAGLGLLGVVARRRKQKAT